MSCLACLIVALLTASVPTAAVDDPLPSPATPAGTRHVPSTDPTGPLQPPLLREGTLLTRAVGALRRDEVLGSWTFIAGSGTDLESTRRITILPGRVLEDLLAVSEERSTGLRFELTGRILIYDGMNFILPSVATPLIDTTGPEAAPAASRPARSPANSLDESEDDVADRLESRLRDRIGSLPVSSDVPDRPASARTLQEGTRLQNRRGMIVRDQRSGTWRFVFDSDGTGIVDPPMELLPCLLLERLQRMAAVSDLPGSVLISGEVTSFRGRNYLLPTNWRPVGGGRNIVR